MEHFDVGSRVGARISRLLPKLMDGLLCCLALLLLFRVFTLSRTPASHTKAVPFTLPVVGGKKFTLLEHRGRVVFLDFSTSWCEACKASLPLVERYAKAHPEVDVLTVDSGEPPAVAASFAREAKLHAVAMDLDERVRATFGVVGFPTIVAIDKAGFIRATWFGYNPAVESVLENARVTFSKNP